MKVENTKMNSVSCATAATFLLLASTWHLVRHSLNGVIPCINRNDVADVGLFMETFLSLYFKLARAKFMTVLYKIVIRIHTGNFLQA